MLFPWIWGFSDWYERAMFCFFFQKFSRFQNATEGQLCFLSDRCQNGYGWQTFELEAPEHDINGYKWYDRWLSVWHCYHKSTRSWLYTVTYTWKCGRCTSVQQDLTEHKSLNTQKSEYTKVWIHRSLNTQKSAETTNQIPTTTLIITVQ